MAFAVDCKIDKGFINRTKTTEAYFNEIRRYPVLTQREERELLEKAKNGSGKEAKDARDKLVNCNQRFVVSVAKKWYDGDNIMDVIEEGNIGLLVALDKYDLTRDERFLTYAVYWIRKYINNYVINKQGIVRPSNANKLYTYVNKARSRFYTLYERYPTLNELKEMLKEKYGITVTDVNDIAQFDVFSIDEGTSYNEDVKPNVKKVQEYIPEISMMFVYAHPEKLDMVKTKLGPVLGEKKLLVANETGLDKINRRFLEAIGR